MKTTEEIKQACADQAALCKEMGYPNFAPLDGRCYRCYNNVYQDIERDGRIVKGYSGKEHVTGCPHCHRSYCD